MLPRRMMPALLTKMSIWPRSSNACAIKSVQADSLEISAGIAIADPPLATMSAATLCAFSAFVSVTTTNAPSPAKR